MLACLIQIDGWDPVAGAPVALRAASHDDPRLCMLNGQTWWPAIEKLPTLRYDFFDGSFGGRITAPTGAMSIATEAWPAFGRYSLADARFRLWTAELGDPWGSFTLRFDGRVTTQPKAADGVAQIAVAVDDRWLDTALLPPYAGTGGAEGPSAMKGQVKPLAIGAPRYVPGVLIDPINSVYQVSAGAVHGFEAALERLARFGAPTADYPSYAALVGAAIPAGRWATAKTAGMARFGAPPAGQISFLLQGDEAGAEGWVRTPGKVIRRLALLSGGAGKVSDASLNALDAARPYNISLYLDEQTTARELIQRIAASLNCVALVNWLGQLVVAPPSLATAPSWTLAADGSALPPVSSVEQVEIAAPFKSIALQGERTWSVHALSDIAFTAPIVDRGSYAAGTVYREGNIVTAADGSRYVYIATTVSAGNAPPNATYWEEWTVGRKPTRGASPPVDVQDGDIWIDTSIVPNLTKYRISGAWVVGANLVTQGADIGVENRATTGNNLVFNGDAEQVPVGAGTEVALAGWMQIQNNSSQPAPGSNSVPGIYNIVSGAYDAVSGKRAIIMAKQSPAVGVGIGCRAFAVQPGEKIVVSVDSYAASGLGNGKYIRAFFTASEPPSGYMAAANIDTTIEIVSTDSAWSYALQHDEKTITVPDGMYWMTIALYCWVGGPASVRWDNVRGFRVVDFATAIGGATKPEANADVTATAQVSIEMVAEKKIAADFNNVLTGTLPVVFSPTVRRAGASIKLLDTVTYGLSEVSGGSVSVSTANGASDKGDVSVTDMTGNKVSFTLAIAVGGIAQAPIKGSLTKQPGSPPTGGGGSVGGNGSIATVGADRMTASTTYQTAHSADPPSITLTSGQKLKVRYSGDYQASQGGASNNASGRRGVFLAEYSANGGSSWTAFGAEVQGSIASKQYYPAGGGGEPIEGYPGHVDVSYDVAGLSAGTYLCRLSFKTSISGYDVALMGENIVFQAAA